MHLRYQHIIWDWNGTLLDDVNFCRLIINRILRENNLKQLSIQEYRDIFTFPVQRYYEKAGLDFSKTSFEDLGLDFMKEYEDNKLNCSLYPYVNKILIDISKSGIKQSVLSAYKEDNLINILNHYKIFEYFEYVVGLDNIYAGSKVHLGLELINKLKVEKDKILFVGDTLHDSDVAEAMGVKCVLIANGHQAKEKLTSNGAFVLNDLKELYAYILG